MGKFIIKKELIEDCKKFLEEELENNFCDRKYYVRTREIKGSDKKWIDMQIYKAMKKQNRLKYLLYILEMNIEAYEDVEKTLKMKQQTSFL